MKAFASIRPPLLMLTGLLLAGTPSLARAADNRASSGAASKDASVSQLNEEGAELYAARDYRRAIEKFIQAYSIDSDPNLLFNIARCYEELGEIEAAVEKYEAFLKTPGADARGRQRARESLAALREMRESEAGGAESPTGHEAPGPLGEQPTSSTPDREGATSGVLPWALLGGSALFAAVGTTFYVLGASDHGKVTDARGFDDENSVADLTRREADDLVSSGDTKKLIGGIGFGLAGALAATYVVLLVSADDDGPAESGPTLGVSLVPSPGGTALMAQGSF